MGSSEKFQLRWNDFQDNLASAFRHLRDDQGSILQNYVSAEKFSS
jgi:hypothetical protein